MDYFIFCIVIEAKIGVKSDHIIFTNFKNYAVTIKPFAIKKSIKLE